MERAPKRGARPRELSVANLDQLLVWCGKAGYRYYVFFTITDDPKLLLITGDLVQSEPAYLQNHAIADSIEKQQHDLISEFCTGASVRPQGRGETATFAASRNPSGVYTDASGGIRCGGYFITRYL